MIFEFLIKPPHFFCSCDICTGYLVDKKKTHRYLEEIENKIHCKDSKWSNFYAKIWIFINSQVFASRVISWIVYYWFIQFKQISLHNKKSHKSFKSFRKKRSDRKISFRAWRITHHLNGIYFCKKKPIKIKICVFLVIVTKLKKFN